MKRRYAWILVVLFLLLTGGVVDVYSQGLDFSSFMPVILNVVSGISDGFTVYLPIVLKEATFTPTLTLTPTRTFTPTQTFTPTFTISPTLTFTATLTNTPTQTATSTKTATPSQTATPTKTATPSQTATITQTPSATPVTSPPLWSRTMYVNTDGGQVLYDKGCELGTQHQNTAGKQDAVVVLDFGSPGAHGDGSLGTTLFGIGVLRTSEIAARVELYAQGYYVCSGTDRTSKLTLAIGTTNYGTWLATGTNARDHGRAWALMVNDVNTWLVQQGYAGQVTAVGASDIELTWNGPGVSKAWVNGYDEVNLYDYYDYGDMAGCPSRDRQSSNCYSPWTMADVWYVAFGTPPSYPLPLIYATNGVNARQWSWLSLWSFNNKGYRMNIAGSFTQCQACLQRSSDPSCPYLNNKPAVGWQQLYDSLIIDGVSQGLRWSTDIFWLADSVNPNLCNATAAPIPGSTLEQRLVDLENGLAAENLSPDMQISLSEKIINTRLVLSQQANTIPAQKIAPLQIPQLAAPEFPVGIFNGDEGLFHPWEAAIINRWQGWDGDTRVQVFAGSFGEESQQGVIYIQRYGARGEVQAMQTVLSPRTNGALKILTVNGNQVSLQAADGSRWSFNWQTGIFE